MKKFSILIITLSLLTQVCFAKTSSKMKITSIFESNEIIPKDFTCNGINYSPPLSWSNIPANTKSLALICDDPDAPAGTWTHWIIFNMPPLSKGLNQGVLPISEIAHETKQGINDFKKIGYGGPCPPNGTHRYFFRLYALNTKLNLESGITKNKLLTAMKGHIISEAELVGKYKK